MQSGLIVALFGMLELEEALARILAAIPAPVGETVPVADADGRVLAEAVSAGIDLPSFDNSAMDGYAVRSADLARASSQNAVVLQIAGKIAAGETFPGEVPPGACVRIFTGSPLPPGADAVVMQEDTETVPGTTGVRFLTSVVAGENVRCRGEDIRAGQKVLAGGERLGPAQLSLLAAFGLTDIKVGRTPAVGLLATGSEIVPAGASPGPLPAGHIYESNGVGLAALARRAGCRARVFPPVTDNLAATRDALAKGFNECDILMTSGGVSVGELDFVKQAFTEMGGKLEFWKVAVKPGRPFVFGRWRERFLFGLPGNPVSAIVTFLLLVRPALLRWQGAGELGLRKERGRLAEPLNNEGERRHFIRVKIDDSGDVHLAGAQASHVLSSLAGANGLVDVPPRTSWPRGREVSVLVW